MGVFFGELYLRTTRPFLDERVTRRESEFIATALHLLPHERVLDICSGHGRHVDLLRYQGYRAWGLEADARSLQEAGVVARAVSIRGDMFHLPFARCFDAAYAWYASLYLASDDALNRSALREAASAVRPGGRILVHGHNPAAQAREPAAHFESALPDGSYLTEDTWFAKDEGVLHGRRILRTASAVLEGEFQVRCPTLEEHHVWCEAEGLAVEGAWGDVEASEPGEATPDLIVLIRRPG